MKYPHRPLPAYFCAAVWLFSPALQAGSDYRPQRLAAGPPVQQIEADDNRFDAAFGKAMTALKARSFEEARLLFVAAADAADITKSPLSWQAAEFNACHVLCLQGRKEEAATLARQIAERCESSLGNEDPLTSEALAYLAFVLTQNGHLERAEPVYRHNVQVLEAKYGQEHYQVATAICKHANLLQNLGRLDEAEKLQRRAFAIMQKIGAEDHPNACYFMTNLASCLQAAHKSDEAAALMNRAFDIVQTTSDADLTSAGLILRKQSEFYRDQHQLDRAEALGRRAVMRLAKRPDINRARFFYYDVVADVYRSILQAQGVASTEIDDRLHQLEAEALAAKATASTIR